MVLKLPRLTWGLLALATLLVGMVVAVELRRSPSEPESAMTNGAKKRHFGFTADQVQTITIQQGGDSLKLYRSSVDPPGWQMDIPQPTPVSVPAVDFLLSTLVNSQSDRDFEASAEQLSEYGLAEPVVILTVQLIDGKTQQVHLGDPDFQGESLYALIDPADPPVATRKIYLVPRTLSELTRRSPQEWQKPPLEDSPMDSDPEVNEAQ